MHAMSCEEPKEMWDSEDQSMQICLIPADFAWKDCCHDVKVTKQKAQPALSKAQEQRSLPGGPDPVPPRYRVLYMLGCLETWESLAWRQRCSPLMIVGKIMVAPYAAARHIIFGLSGHVRGLQKWLSILEEPLASSAITSNSLPIIATLFSYCEWTSFRLYRSTSRFSTTPFSYHHSHAQPPRSFAHDMDCYFHYHHYRRCRASLCCC